MTTPERDVAAITDALLAAIADLGRYEFEHPATGGLAPRLEIVFDLAGEVRSLLLSSPDPVAGDGLDPARLLRAMYARLPYDNWTFTPEANASSVAREYDRLTAAAPLSSPVEPPPGLDEAWRKAEAAVGRHMPGGGFGVEADGPGYRAHAGHEEWHGGYREAWSVTDAELVGDPDDPATPAKALLKLAAALLPTQASDSPEKTT